MFMADHSELTAVLLSILDRGILRTRAQAWSGQSDQCGVEADHLHNLPTLILRPNLPELSYYFNVTRIAFISRCLDTKEFEDDWKRLASIISEMRRLV